ncbi:hypothetical protein [Nocardia abscessus]|uniref:hypothetical protein n=1 Tax=Nocardia abscessus TaxID=120957 RepID=UPI002454CF94|nr:hypothetical protein [Nocardia abscessus]
MRDPAALRAEIERMYGAVLNGAQVNIRTGECRNQKKAGYLQALEEVLALLPKES